MNRLNWLRNISLIDSAAAAIACLALVGVVWSPKLNQAIAKASGSMQSVGVSVDVRNLQLAQPERLLQSIRDEGSVNIMIRNQPAGHVQLLDVVDITQPLMVMQPDGRIVEAQIANQTQEFHVRFSLRADAEADASGVVFGGTKLKIGVPVDLQGRLYNFRGVVSGITLP